ncbi:MAG: signal peptidase I [Firmicutes bacterium]|nr:signal peptidase I [Bacillota bacterium]
MSALHSLEPALHNGDYLITSKITYDINAPKKGDVVIFMVEEENRLYIKRVIGTPGDIINIKNGKVYINDRIDDETCTLDGYTPGELADYVVPDGEVFVLGDNRLNSIDSREIGTQKISDIKGVVLFRVWPFNSIDREL